MSPSFYLYILASRCNNYSRWLNDDTMTTMTYYAADFIVHYNNEELSLESLGDQLASATRRI